LCLAKLVQPYGSQWSAGYLWRWTDPLQRLVLIVLALMLIRVVAVVADFWYRYRLAALAEATNASHRAQRKTAPELSLKLGSLRSVFTTAPYLGLVGSCLGILNTFRGYEGSRSGFVVMVVSGMGAALLSTAAGMLVAVPAMCFYNYLRTRKDLLEGKMQGGPLEKRRFPLRARLSAFPFSAMLASTLAISLAAFMIFPSFHVSKGLTVRLLRIGALERQQIGEPIVIKIGLAKTNNSPVVHVNSTKTALDELEKDLRTELQSRPPKSVAYVQAENGVLWRDVVSVVDVAQRLHADVVLLTATPVVHVHGMSAR
jgi:biopolymer transport protein ExbD